jgi:hypothetical protein
MAKWGWWNPASDWWNNIQKSDAQADSEMKRIREGAPGYQRVKVLIDDGDFILVMDTESKTIEMLFWMCKKGDSA